MTLVKDDRGYCRYIATMETENEFLERRRIAHEQARMEAADDPLIQACFGPHPEQAPLAPTYTSDFMFKRQAE